MGFGWGYVSVFLFVCLLVCLDKSERTCVGYFRPTPYAVWHLLLATHMQERANHCCWSVFSMRVSLLTPP